MSTGPKTQAAFIQGNQGSVEHGSPHSALFYLFQEVSKLASPIHDSFLDSNSPSAWLQETSGQPPVMLEKEDARVFQISGGSCQRSLPCVSLRDDGDEAEPHPERSSPWKVLSLINLQCERLLHHSDTEEPEPGLVKSSLSVDKASSAAVDVTERGVGGVCVSAECTVRPPDSPVEALRGDCSEGASGCKPQCSQTAEKTDTARPQLVEKNPTASSQRRGKKEGNPCVNVQLEWDQECKKNCLSSEQVIMNETFPEKALSQTHISTASLGVLLTFNSIADATVALSKPAITLDHNANLTLTLTEPPCDTQLLPPNSILPSSPSPSPSLSPSFPFSTTEKRCSLSTENAEITACKPDCTHASIEENSPAVELLTFSGNNGETKPSQCAAPKAVQTEEHSPPSTQQWRTKTPRKQPHPSRSADIQDPDFQGVSFRMDTELDDSRKQCRLLITSQYSKELCKSGRKPRLRTRTSQKSLKTSSSEEESDLMTSVCKSKVCASCSTRKTPMWRDAEDGTPLCNACGIRYKKYKVRCVNCWHIPRKEGNSNSCCRKCGNFVRLTSAQRKHTT